jgi:predicted GNAT family N-acyltransferase
MLNLQFIDFATPAFDEALALRDAILRKPLNMVFETADIVDEWNSYHLVCYNMYNDMVGCLTLKPQEEGVIKMRQVAVKKNSQNLGIGSALVNESERFCAECGFKKIVLHARKEAVSFYRKLGYKTQGKQFKEVGIPHSKMYKNL